jgi:hypothetical protein
LSERFADWRAGRHDGLLGLPSVPARLLDVGPDHPVADPPVDGEVSTVWLSGIRHDNAGRCEGERQMFLRYSESMYERLSRADEGAQKAEAALKERRDDVRMAKQEPTEAQLNTRRLAEDALSSPELVRRRRLGDHQRRLRAAEDRLAVAEADAATARAARDTLNRTVQGRWSLTVVRARRLHEHAQRRAHVYWRQLVRTHAQGDVLNGALARVGPELPEWARGDAPMPALSQEPPQGADDGITPPPSSQEEE